MKVRVAKKVTRRNSATLAYRKTTGRRALDVWCAWKRRIGWDVARFEYGGRRYAHASPPGWRESSFWLALPSPPEVSTLSTHTHVSVCLSPIKAIELSSEKIP